MEPSDVVERGIITREETSKKPFCFTYKQSSSNVFSLKAII